MYKFLFELYILMCLDICIVYFTFILIILYYYLLLIFFFFDDFIYKFIIYVSCHVNDNY
jgi:hypothetical protein